MRPNLSRAALEDEEEFPEPPRLRLLRRLVMALTVTLALGMIVIAGTVAWRLWSPPKAAAPVAPAAPVSAERLVLPQGAEITALGATPTEILATVAGPEGAERLLVYRRADGELLSETPIRRE